MARTEECILYRNFDNGEVLDRMTSLMNSYEAGEEGFENRKEEFFHMAGSLVEMTGMYGFSGNLWHTYPVSYTHLQQIIRILLRQGRNIIIYLMLMLHTRMRLTVKYIKICLSDYLQRFK